VIGSRTSRAERSEGPARRIEEEGRFHRRPGVRGGDRRRRFARAAFPQRRSATALRRLDVDFIRDVPVDGDRRLPDLEDERGGPLQEPNPASRDDSRAESFSRRFFDRGVMKTIRTVSPRDASVRRMTRGRISVRIRSQQSLSESGGRAGQAGDGEKGADTLYTGSVRICSNWQALFSICALSRSNRL